MPLNGLLAPANMPPSDLLLTDTAPAAPSTSEGAVAAPTGAEGSRPPQNTPLWMETSASLPAPRRGHGATAPRSGMNTLVFFALIVVAVAAAGIGGVAVWGPEKPIKNRTQFATNPPAPIPLPSLPASAEGPEAPPPEPPASAAAAGLEESAPPTVASSAPVAKKPTTKKSRAGKKR